VLQAKKQFVISTVAINFLVNIGGNSTFAYIQHLADQTLA
jgi:hypothetical protein